MEYRRIVVGPLLTNCYVVWDEAKNAFVIDPGDDAALIQSFINKHSLDLQCIINTHSHIDHIKADAALGVPVYIHELEAAALRDPKNNFSVSLLGGFTPCTPKALLHDGQQLSIGTMRPRIIHTPGHSVGGISIALDAVLFTGDTLFRNGMGRTDLPGGSHDQIMQSIEKKLLCFEDSVRIYPGHGESSTIGEERSHF